MSKKQEELVQKFLNSASYLRKGAGHLADRWKVDRVDVYEARDEARRRLRNKQDKTIKRLFFDIETAPNIAYVWKTGYKLSVPFQAIIEERAIMCISYKWAGEDEVHNIFWKGYYDDKNILEAFIPILKKADEVVGHNSDKFDIKWVNTRAAFHGLNLPSKFRSFDTIKKARAQFTLNSNSLKYIAEFFNLTGKIETGGFDLWKDILGDKTGKTTPAKEAKEKMIEYCNGDVITLEDVYNYIEKYSKPITNHAVLQGGAKYHCPACASIHTSLMKTSTPVSGIIKRHMECDLCNVNFDISNKTYMLYLDNKMNNNDNTK
jgi:hypothetical protein